MGRAEWALALALVACGVQRTDRTPSGRRAPEVAAASWLSQTGLYADITRKRVASDVVAYEPRYVLWSDGATKRRWLRLPAGTAIDMREPDHWRFPIGSVLFKEFTEDGKRLETRVLARVDDEQWFAGAFVWEDGERDAHLVREGARDVRGTTHDVPSADECVLCHGGEPGRVLGISAVQRGEVTLSVGPDAELALGYLHANCGHCHNSHGAAWPYTDLDLRLHTGDGHAGATAAQRSTVNVAMSAQEVSVLRVVPGRPAESGVWIRMATRGVAAQMPPLSSERVDPAGLTAVARWIEQL